MNALVFRSVIHPDSEKNCEYLNNLHKIIVLMKYIKSDIESNFCS